MKNLNIYVSTLLLSAVVFYHAQAQAVTNPDSTKKQLDRLLASKDPSVRQLLNGRLKSLAASNNEMDMSIAASYYYQIKNTKAFDSVNTAEIIKFPKGLEARIKAQQVITRMKNLSEMEIAYHEFIKNFPPDNYPKLPLGEDRLPYDRVRINLADGFAKEKNVAKANYYAGLLEADFWKGKAYGGLSDTFYANGDLSNAALYQKKAVENAQPYAEGKMGNSATADFAASGYATECGNYARILYEQKKYNEALKYIAIADKTAKVPRPEFDYVYAEILAALNRHQEAYHRIEVAIKSGEASEKMSDLFKVLYVKVNGSDTGLNAYQADIRKGVINDLRRRLTANMVNQPAADFTLTDLTGEKVTLSDLKGKVIILDFWATWCVPCKASFPAMQAAQNKYKNDPDVKFLFIHTWERVPAAAEDARAFITGMKYDFEVLMDTKDPETKANKVVDSYHVTSIPTKFVIDEKGNIRFRLTGFNGSKEAAVDEISMMIDMVRNY